MATKTTIRLDVAAIVRIFGGPTEMRFRLDRHGLGEVSEHAVSKWIERGRLPGEWLVALLVLAKIERMRFSPLQFLIKDSIPADMRRKITRSDAAAMQL